MVHRLTRFGFVNAYLVEEEDGLTVVDTMVGGSADAILTAATALGRPIVRIACTHAHGDHIGSLDQLAARVPGAEVLISERDARLLAGNRAGLPGEPDGARVRGSVPGARTRPTRLLRHGDRVGSLEVVASPGHTPGHLAFLDTRDRTLYCGDAYTTIGGVATSARGWWWFPLASVATWHRPTALASARTLRALDPARLAAGHGRPVESPVAAMERAIGRGA
ncbi:MAG TPA: MBL fold metallo-hydrolase [Candidatus Micrarchaeia archaeon]|nr:MBL fold metallo-hydrolase [Candidatus Micrarchaeia archaeon]